jgi:aminomethyltransferase
MEAGIFNYGNDMDVTNNPFEITGLERLVELGDDRQVIAGPALERIAADGVRKKLVGVRLGGEPLTMWLEDFWPVTSAGREVGRLTSAAYSPRLRFNMGYAWLPIDLSAMGTRVLAMSPDGPLDAEVVPLPFWDPAKAVPKA